MKIAIIILISMVHIFFTMFVIFIVFPLMAIGCISCVSETQKVPEKPHHRTVPILQDDDTVNVNCISQTISYRIDSKFTTTQINEIRKALQAWTDGTNGRVNWVESDTGVPFVKVTEDDLEIIETTAQTMHARDGVIVFNPTAGYCSNCFDKSNGPIQIKLVGSKLKPGMAYLIARHEIGHYLGLRHSAEPHTVMYFSVDSGYIGEGITDADRNQFDQVWCKR